MIERGPPLGWGPLSLTDCQDLCLRAQRARPGPGEGRTADAGSFFSHQTEQEEDKTG